MQLKALNLHLDLAQENTSARAGRYDSYCSYCGHCSK